MTGAKTITIKRDRISKWKKKRKKRENQPTVRN
jgi:hypothetical protein